MTAAVNDADILAIPTALLQALIEWATKGRRPGHFLTAVLENNLSEAFARAGEESTQALPAIVSFIQSDMPAPSWGSPEKVAAWEKRGGIRHWHGDTPRWGLALTAVARHQHIPTHAPAGTAVIVVRGDGSELKTITRSNPWNTGGVQGWLVIVDGINQPYPIERVRLADEAADEEPNEQGKDRT